ncbi:hypothetical protein BaRGS_00005673, partial [Batillaria attramentaria]
VADTSGPLWKAQRKTCLEILREFGMGKNVLALKVQEEVDEYVNAIASKHSQPFDMTRMTQISISNNICSIVFGKRFDYQDPVFLDYVRAVDEYLSTSSANNPGVIFPNLRFIPGDPFKVHKRLQDFRMLLSKFIQPAIDRHVQEFDEDCVDDFISAYIRQLGEHRTRETHDYINEKNLPKVVLDLFGAGTETTSNAIRWTVAYFLHHPHVQDKCYQEIVNVIGTDRKPEMTDRQEMTYLEATIMEVLRIADIVPMSLPHSTSCDVTLAGYTIPKDAFIMPNLDSVLQDPEVWGDPDKFRPDRFIGPDGKIIRPDEFIPFSVGRRVCLGESLARMELFLYLTTMIQHFRFLPPEDDQLPSLEGIMGMTYSPKRFLVRAVPRKETELFAIQRIYSFYPVFRSRAEKELAEFRLVRTTQQPRHRNQSVPPGPGFALPLLGHLHLLETDPRAKFREWRRQYGDVFSFYMAGRLVVVLNGYDVIKQALVKQADTFSDRPHFLLLELMTDARGVADASGPLWKAQRKTCLEILREFGMGKNVLALKVQEEVDEYVNAIASKHGQPFDMTRMTQISVSNNICSIVFGKRFDYQDPVFLDYVRVLDENLSTNSSSNPGVIFPNLRFIPGDPFKVHKRLQDFRMLISKFIQPAIDRHVQEFDEDCVDDFISAYIRQIGEHRTRETHDYINEKNLPKVVLDLFGAGTETTSNAIRWTVAYFLHHPHVQDKCYQEIVNVIGTDRKPEMTDRQEMTYLEATIMEVLRIADIVPMSLPHATSCDVTLAGYTVPKDAFIMPNLDSVLQDPEVWGDPDKFRPDRFIGHDGKIIRPDEFIPFSVGRRVCLGESLARMELFLYLTTMIQHFRFLPPENDQLPSLEGILGLTYSPKRFLVRAVPR